MNYVYIALVVVALVVIELLIGGTRLLFSLPSYSLLALTSVLSLYSFRRPQIAANIYCLMATGFFFAYIILRCLFSPVEYLARSDLYIVLGALMVYLLFALILTMPKYRFIFVMTLLVIGLVHVSIGGIQYLRGERFPIFDWLQKADYGLRATGLYICPNHLAGYLEVTAIMGLSIVCWSRQSFWLKLLAGYGTIICGIGIVMTGSRGGYVSTIVGVLVFAVLSFLAIRRAQRQQLWVSAVSAIVVAIVMFASVTMLFSRHYPLQARIVRIFSGGGDARLDLWKAAISQSKMNPVVGTGSGTYQYIARLFRPPLTQGDPVYAHNDYLQLLAEYGIIGLAAGMIFLLCHLWWGWKALRYFVTDRPVAKYRLQSDALALNIGAFSVVAVYAVHSILDFNLHIPANAILLAFIFGTLANPGIVMPFETETYEKTSHYLKLALPAIGIWIAAAGLPTLPAEFFTEEARVAVKEERYQQAVESANIGLAGDKTNPLLWLYLGQAHAGLGENSTNAASARESFNAAVDAFRKGIEYYPQEQWLLVGLGSALGELGRFEEAEPVFQQAVRWNPTSAYIRTYYATHLRLARKFPEAEAQYKKSLALYWNQGALHGLELLAKARDVKATHVPQ